MKNNWLAKILLGFTLLQTRVGLVMAKSLGGTIDGSDISPYAETVSDETDVAVTLANILSAVVGFMTILAGIFFLFNFIVGAMGWMSSGGDTQKIREARDKMVNGAVGLLIVVASYSVIYIVGAILGVNFLDLNSAIGLLNANNVN